MMGRVILWLVFCVLALDFIVSITTQIICIKAWGKDWLRDSLFDILVLVAIVIAEIFILKEIY